jgi:hypothetical protein
MSNFLQVVIPAVLGFIAAYQGGLTRTSRLRSIIRANVELLGSLPDDHPSREALSAHIEDLVGTLVRRQRRRFEPITRAGVSFGANVAFALVTLLLVAAVVSQMVGLWRPSREPLSRGDLWVNLVLYGALTVCFAGFAVRAWIRQRREHPESAQPGQA